jgi:hypothetical protein
VVSSRATLVVTLQKQQCRHSDFIPGPENREQDYLDDTAKWHFLLNPKERMTLKTLGIEHFFARMAHGAPADNDSCNEQQSDAHHPPTIWGRIEQLC